MRDHPQTEHGNEETFDLEINVKSVVMTGVWLFAGIAVSMVLMWFLVGVLKNERVAADPAPTALEVRGPVMPPGERLQPSPFEGLDTATPERQLDAFLAEQRTIVESYGWVSKEGGLARIPIDRAIELLLAKSLEPATPTVETVHFPPAVPAAAGH